MKWTGPLVSPLSGLDLTPLQWIRSAQTKATTTTPDSQIMAHQVEGLPMRMILCNSIVTTRTFLAILATCPGKTTAHSSIHALFALIVHKDKIIVSFLIVRNAVFFFMSRLQQTHGTGYTAASRLALMAPPAPDKKNRPQSSYDQKRARRVVTASHWLAGSTFSGYASVFPAHLL